MSLLDKASLIVTPNGFKASKLYSVVPSDGSGDMTVTRATTATRVNSAGLIESVASNVPRLDYVNSACPSLLVEPQRTNLQTYSEDFSNAAYIKEGSTVTTNTSVSPDGATTADFLKEDSSTGFHTAISIATQSTSGDYTFSMFVKAAGRTKIEFREAFSIGGFVVFDLVAGTATTTSPAKNGKIENYGNGWYKCSATWSFVGGAYTLIYLNILNNSSSHSYAGDNTSGVILWGAQLESGSYSTSYIPTTTASVTRNADVISKTGITSLIGQTEGTIFTDFVCNGFENFGTPFSINDGTSLNSIWITTFGNGTIRGEVYGSSNVQASFSMSGGVVGQRYKLALAYKLNDFAMYINGNLIGTDTSGTVPINLSRADFDFGNASSFVKSLLRINSAQLYKTRLSNAELATLTTI